MSLLAMLKGGRPQGFANAKAANLANVGTVTTPTLATLATIALANLQSPPANDPAPAPTTKVQAVFTESGNKLIDIGTVRPPGLSPPLLAASLALDAQIHAAGQFDNSDEIPDRWCYQHSTAMTASEIDTHAARLVRFTDKGLTQIDAEALADKLVQRDRDSDDRRLCLECTYMAGYGSSNWRCGNWQRSGFSTNPRNTQLPAGLFFQLQRCGGFTAPKLQRTPT